MRTAAATAAAVGSLRLTAARAGAWALLVAGWVGIGSLALRFAPSLVGGFALTALWLLALGAAATVATRGHVGAGSRAAALALAAAVTTGGLLASVHGAGQGGVLVALLGWAALTALASGVVRALRLTQAAAPKPPIAAASLGALCAGLVLGDPGDVQPLAVRLAVFVVVVAAVLAGLQSGMSPARPPEGANSLSEGRGRRPKGAPVCALRSAPGCRAGLFDCSLPAWPAGAWRDARQWPVLLAGLAMLPMMAALPLLADWCRATQVPAQALILLHLAAMFGPAWLLQGVLARDDDRSARRLATACTALLSAGALVVLFAPAPWDAIGLALGHGAAWGLAWSGQLWAPARRGRQGTSPVRAAAGYAVLTLAFGLLVQHNGPAGVVQVHVALGALAALAWLLRGVMPLPPAAVPAHPESAP